MKLPIIQRLLRQLSVFLLAGLVVLLPLSSTACTTKSLAQQDAASEHDTTDSLTIVASIFAPYDFSRTIAGEVAEVSLLVPPGAESHSFEPSPADLILLNTADVFIYVGGESDAWLEKIIASLDNPGLTLIRLTDLVETLDEEALRLTDTAGQANDAAADENEIEIVDATEDEHEHEIDEHVWTSVRNAQTIASALANTFAELDEGHAQLFSTNAQAYNLELAALDKRFTDIVANAERTTLVFGDRFPFRYFVEDYGLSYYAAFPGCSTAVDTNPKTITFLIDKVREEHIPVVFYIELSDQRIAHTIAEETGTQLLSFHSVHNITKEDLAAGATYLSLMQANADNLKVALN